MKKWMKILKIEILNIKFIWFKNWRRRIYNEFIIKNINYNIDENNIVSGIFNLSFFVDEWYNILNLINDKCDKIFIREIGKDYSFKLNILDKKDKQGILFNQILNIKTTNDLVSEVSINMESLENILTKL